MWGNDLDATDTFNRLEFACDADGDQKKQNNSAEVSTWTLAIFSFSHDGLQPFTVWITEISTQAEISALHLLLQFSQNHSK
jgi:hypothetical protein